jgi:hypothetical protein
MTKLPLNGVADRRKTGLNKRPAVEGKIERQPRHGAVSDL